MRIHIAIICFLWALQTGFALRADPAAWSEETYYVGRTDSVGKDYSYCRLLSVKMLRESDGSWRLIWRTKDDLGKLLVSQSSDLTLKQGEVEAFAALFSKAWDVIDKKTETRPDPATLLGQFRGEEARLYWDDWGGLLTMAWPGRKLGKPDLLNLSTEGICATLAVLSQFDKGRKVTGNGERFRIGMKKEPVLTLFKEQEEIDLSRSIVKKFKAGNWPDWEDRVGRSPMDFQLLSPREKHYLSVVFPRTGPQKGSMINLSTPFIVRLKLDDPVVIEDLREAFRTGYFEADNARDACRRAANVKLLSVAAAFLFTDQAPKEVEMGDVLTDPRPSIHSAAAINLLLMVCPEFSKAMREAAKTWDVNGYVPDEYLEPCRKWWQENRVRIEKGQYKGLSQLPARKVAE